MRQDGTSNGFLYQFTDPDGEAFISLSAAARGALRRLSKSDSESEEEEEPVQKHRLLGAEFDYHVGGLGSPRPRGQDRKRRFARSPLQGPAVQRRPAPGRS